MGRSFPEGSGGRAELVRLVDEELDPLASTQNLRAGDALAQFTHTHEIHKLTASMFLTMMSWKKKRFSLDSSRSGQGGAATFTLASSFWAVLMGSFGGESTNSC